MVFLAVRPQIAESVLRPLHFRAGQNVVSLIAGVSCQTISDWTGATQLTRAIPLPFVQDRSDVTPIHPPRADVAQVFDALGKALQDVGAATKAAWATGQPADALANAVPYMQAFGHTVLAWVWLDLALATLADDAALAQPASVGRMGSMRYFFHYELPKIGAWLQVVSTRDATCASFPEDAF
eukprot:gene37089-60327_t